MDTAVIDAAKAMGTRDYQLLHVVQMPLALPFVFASIQSGVVQGTQSPKPPPMLAAVSATGFSRGSLPTTFRGCSRVRCRSR